MHLIWLLQVTSCTHIFCKSCLIDFSASVGQVSCPSCSEPLTVDFTANDKGDQKSKATIKGFRSSSILNRIHLDNFQTSTKIEALVSNYLPINEYILSRLYMFLYFIIFLSLRVQEAAILHHLQELDMFPKAPIPSNLADIGSRCYAFSLSGCCTLVNLLDMHLG